MAKCQILGGGGGIGTQRMTRLVPQVHSENRSCAAEKRHFMSHKQFFFARLRPPRSDGFDIPSAAIINNFGR